MRIASRISTTNACRIATAQLSDGGFGSHGTGRYIDRTMGELTGEERAALETQATALVERARDRVLRQQLERGSGEWQRFAKIYCRRVAGSAGHLRSNWRCRCINCACFAETHLPCGVGHTDASLLRSDTSLCFSHYLVRMMLVDGCIIHPDPRCRRAAVPARKYRCTSRTSTRLRRNSPEDQGQRRRA